jgi:hypothetical protein
MGMDEPRRVAFDRAAADFGGNETECGKALPIIGPVLAVGPEIGIAGTGIKMRCIEDEKMALGEEPRMSIIISPPADRSSAG